MLHPAPTTKIDPTLTRAVIGSVIDETDRTPAYVVLTFPNTNYQTRLVPTTDLETLRSNVGEMVLGAVSMTARRVDITGAGGRVIDPCVGTPRRIQGTINAIDPGANVLVVNVGPGFNVRLKLGAPGQQAQDFVNADFVTCDVLPGASFAFSKVYRVEG